MASGKNVEGQTLLVRTTNWPKNGQRGNRDRMNVGDGGSKKNKIVKNIKGGHESNFGRRAMKLPTENRFR